MELYKYDISEQEVMINIVDILVRWGWGVIDCYNSKSGCFKIRPRNFEFLTSS
jgi:hypothetical protein